MRLLRECADMVLSGHTMCQKMNYIRYLLSKKAERLTYGPLTLSIVATTRCTLACDMCPTHSSIVPRDYPHAQRNVKDIDITTFSDIIDRFPCAATVQIIGSGEPMLNKDFFRMVEYAAREGMTVKTFSNGTTVADNVDAILASRLDGITISINGHCAGEFSRMTGMDEAQYGKIYDGVKKLVEARDRAGSRVRVKLSFIIDRINYRYIPDMVDVGLKLGVDHMFFCNFLATPCDGLRAEERIITSEPALCAELREMFGRYEPAIRKKLTPPVPVALGSRTDACDAHFTQIRFDGDGNISSCSMMLLNMTGNGRYTDPDVWNNDFFRTMRRMFLSGGGERLPDPCRWCPENAGVGL